MPFIPVPGVLQVNLQYGALGEPFENTLYFEKAGAWTGTEMGELGLSLHDWWVASMAPIFPTGVSLINIKMTDLTTATSGGMDYGTDLPESGTVNDEIAPLNVAPCISIRTASRGRSNRGRNYISGLGVGSIANNTIVGTAMTALVAAYNGLFSVATDNGCVPVVVSRYSGVDPVTHDPIPRAEGVTTPVTGYSFTDNVVDSQRRRLPNH